MKLTSVLSAVFFLSLAAAGVHLMLVAHQEQRERVVGAVSEGYFTSLQPCDVPGLRERVLSRGGNTIAFAGEFTPVATIPWVPGKNRIYLYVISGSGVARFEGATHRITAGDLVVIPKAARHAVSAVTPTMRAIYIEDGT